MTAGGPHLTLLSVPSNSALTPPLKSCSAKHKCHHKSVPPSSEGGIIQAYRSHCHLYSDGFSSSISTIYLLLSLGTANRWDTLLVCAPSPKFIS